MLLRTINQLINRFSPLVTPSVQTGGFRTSLIESSYAFTRFGYAISARQPVPKTSLHLKNLDIPEMIALLNPTQKNTLESLSTGSMSFGSISLETHSTIAEGVNRIAMSLHGVQSLVDLKKIPQYKGPISRSGEGGEHAARDNSIQQSLGRQVATGRFGVNGRYLAHALELEIKVNQGAKPGIGGELPGKKVTPLIAEARLTTPGVTLASPPPHHDIYSIEDLKQLVFDLRSANPEAKITIKLAASDGIGVIAAGCVKCGIDGINIAGPGGTGAAPVSAKFDFVHPWEKALAEVHQTLTEQGLRDRVSLTVSGGMQTGLDCFKALLLGANAIEVGTSVLVSLGCVMAEVCHEGTCPAGIATTNPALIEEKFKGRPEDVARSLIQTAVSLADYLQHYGFNAPEQAVGRTDLLEVKRNAPLKGLDKLLFQPKNPFIASKPILGEKGSSYAEQTVIWGIQAGQNEFELQAANTIRSFSARLAYHSIKDDRFREAFYKKPLTIRFNGLACGQSFGFIAPKNLTLIVANANDGTGKSLDGGTIYVTNQAGNTTGYGATAGNIYVKETGGRAAARNSGANIVTEALGADGANFMTGGSLTILGHPRYYLGLGPIKNNQSPRMFQSAVVGPNFGSGFSGGSIYMPVALFEELKQSNHLAESVRTLSPQGLGSKDRKILAQRLIEYKKEIPNPLIDALLADPKSLSRFFIKLEPVAKTNDLAIAPNPEPIGRVDLASDALMSSFELKSSDAMLSTAPVQGLGSSQSIPKDSCGTGLLLNRQGQVSKSIVDNALTMLAGFSHRGATGVDPQTGDGCGITWYGLDGFFQQCFPALHLSKGNYAILHIALPRDPREFERAQELVNRLLTQEELVPRAERKVPVNQSVLGYLGQSSAPRMRQLVIKKSAEWSPDEFEKKLIRMSLRFEFLVHNQPYSIRPHIISASSQGVIYKAMTREEYFGDYFKDFSDPEFKASAAAAHARFSTNTLPAFMNIQMFRNLGNNGENNALQQIVRNLTHAPQLKQILGLETIDLSGFSDSHIMSIFMDLLRLQGASAEDIVASTIHPYDPAENPGLRWYNLLGVPFEGPNASVLTLGSKIILVRDRNGFRPLRAVINDELIYCGSELGTVDVKGEVFGLKPAQPLLIDLEQHTIAPLVIPPLEQAGVKPLDELINEVKPAPMMIMDAEELELRKQRAGWTKEIDEKVMQPYRRMGKDAIVSMGDQRPAEALVNGAFVDLGAFFRGKFSQVTNPPLDAKREKIYMSLHTLAGKKPALGAIANNTAVGYLLDSPVVTNQQLAALLQADNLKAQTLSIVYPVDEQVEGMKERIAQICERAVELAMEDHLFILLSDRDTDAKHAAIPPVIIASLVHDALLIAGIRREVTLGLESASVLTGRDLAQVISIGGVDVVNPYLGFTSVQADLENPEQFLRQTSNYHQALNDDLLNFMARVGISTVSAYRGTKAFNAYGIDEDLAASLGVNSDLGGVGLREIARFIATRHKYPRPEGLGRLDSESSARPKRWNARNTIASIRRARGELDNLAVEPVMDSILISPRNLFFLKKPAFWSETNPMPVCILGGGAAGFYQAQSLLDSGLPLRLTMIEKNIVNRFGLVGDGIAPDHKGTKNQAKLLKNLLSDPRVVYYGGVEIGSNLSIETLKKQFPCIIDCRGAPIDTRLGISGEDCAGVIPASRVYKAYNNAFDPLGNSITEETLFFPSKNTEIGIIGSGNVAADLARILLKPVDDLRPTTISPRFLSMLETNAPDCVRIFARSGPHKSKISLNELEQLKAIPTLSLTAHFDLDGLDLNTLTVDERKRLDFFMAIKDRPLAKGATRQLCFHFNEKPACFKSIEDGIEASFTGLHNRTQRWQAKAFIVAIGNQPVADNSLADAEIYRSGWVTGRGGKLGEAESSAEETTRTIRRDFLTQVFHSRIVSLDQQEWQLQSPIGNQEQLNILNYLDAGNNLETVADLQQARRFQPYAVPSDRIEEEGLTLMAPGVNPEPDSIILFDKETGNSDRMKAVGEQTLLDALLEKGLAPPCQCGGDKKCGECMVSTVTPIPLDKKEKAIIEANGGDSRSSILACAHRLSQLGGSIFHSPVRLAKDLEKGAESLTPKP